MRVELIAKLIENAAGHCSWNSYLSWLEAEGDDIEDLIKECVGFALKMEKITLSIGQIFNSDFRSA
jgi:hypothetical protein